MGWLRRGRPAQPDEDDDPQPKRGAPSLGDFHVETEEERRERILRVVVVPGPLGPAPAKSRRA